MINPEENLSIVMDNLTIADDTNSRRYHPGSGVATKTPPSTGALSSTSSTVSSRCGAEPRHPR